MLRAQPRLAQAINGAAHIQNYRLIESSPVNALLMLQALQHTAQAINSAAQIANHWLIESSLVNLMLHKPVGTSQYSN